MTNPERSPDDETAEGLMPMVAVVDALTQGNFQETLTEEGYEEFRQGIATICGGQAANTGKVLAQVFYCDPKEISDDNQISWVGLEFNFARREAMTALEFTNVIVPEYDFNPMIDPDYAGYAHLVIQKEQINWDLFEE